MDAHMCGSLRNTDNCKKKKIVATLCEWET